MFIVGCVYVCMYISIYIIVYCVTESKIDATFDAVRQDIYKDEAGDNIVPLLFDGSALESEGIVNLVNIITTAHSTTCYMSLLTTNPSCWVYNNALNSLSNYVCM
jgi:hypothetical protein